MGEWGGVQRERESQAGSTLLAQSLNGALTHKPWDHDLGQNQESDAQPTELPTRPFSIFNNTNTSMQRKNVVYFPMAEENWRGTSEVSTDCYNMFP